ncbi:MAG: allophanate hydrolase subunit 1 [Verrucomicrobiota bacterium]
MKKAREQQPSLIGYGENNWLLRWQDEASFRLDARRLLDALAIFPPTHLLEFVPGFQTLLLIHSQPVSEKYIRDWLKKALNHNPSTSSDPQTHVISVDYSGEDLEALAREKGLSTQEIIRLHAETSYTVLLLGFSPGFPYLGPLSNILHTPRKDSPRKRIRPGSVAIGGPHTGIYTVESPGGWHIIGHTQERLFFPEKMEANDLSTNEIFRLNPGDLVKFEAVSS